MNRQAMPKGTDKHVFTSSAVRTKAINLSPVIYRGGIRL